MFPSHPSQYAQATEFLTGSHTYKIICISQADAVKFLELGHSNMSQKLKHKHVVCYSLSIKTKYVYTKIYILTRHS